MVHILIMGSDEAPHRFGHRTDTMMIVSLDLDARRVILLSIPRDLYVYLPGRSMERINSASVFGGMDMVYDTVLYNLGIQVDNWVMVNFDGFIQAVDLLGGIDVQVGRGLADECGGTYFTYSPGTYHMNGFTALCYVRMRKASSDFDRLRRQQEVALAIFRQVLSLDGLKRAPELYQEFKRFVATDLGLTELLGLIPLAAEVASGKVQVETYAIGTDLVRPFRVPTSGAAVLLPKREALEAYLREIYLAP
jgi:LCP family protein required for cell wall assembly